MKMSDFIPKGTYMAIAATAVSSNRHRDALNKPKSWDELTPLQKKKARQDANAIYDALEKYWTLETLGRGF